MSKKILIIAVVVIMLASTAAILVGCNEGNYNKSVYDKLDNMASGATYYDKNNKEINRFQLSSKQGWSDNITIDLGSSKEYNTIVLKESQNGVKKFHIFGSNTNQTDYQLIHVGDSIEGLRVCHLGEGVSYRYLRVYVADHDGSYTVNNIGVYNKKVSQDTELRRTGYLVMDNIDENTDLSMLNGLTDVILFGWVGYKSDGNIQVMAGEDGNKVDVGIEVYKKKVDLIRQKVGDHKLNYFIDIHLPYNEGNTTIYQIFTTHRENMMSSIKSLIDNCDLDGYAIDFEYPINNKEWKAYNNILVDIKAKIGDKLLLVATSGWTAHRFNKAAIEAIDRVEVMTYDLMDEHGYQSPFYNTAVEQIEKMVQAGFDRADLDYGVPYYSRPLDGYAYWGTYNQIADKLGRYEFMDYAPITDHSGYPLTSPRYYNNVTMIADKTAYALDSGIGGMMIWHMTCDTSYDNDLSLTKAMVDTIAQKKMGNVA